MKGTAWGVLFALSLLLTACAASQESARMQALYEKYDKHCREHAHDMTAEADEHERYEDCMTYFINTDPECPIEMTDDHLTRK